MCSYVFLFIIRHLSLLLLLLLSCSGRSRRSKSSSRTLLPRRLIRPADSRFHPCLCLVKPTRRIKSSRLRAPRRSLVPTTLDYSTITNRHHFSPSLALVAADTPPPLSISFYPVATGSTKATSFPNAFRRDTPSDTSRQTRRGSVNTVSLANFATPFSSLRRKYRSVRRLCSVILRSLTKPATLSRPRLGLLWRETSTRRRKLRTQTLSVYPKRLNNRCDSSSCSKRRALRSECYITTRKRRRKKRTSKSRTRKPLELQRRTMRMTRLTMSSVAAVAVAVAAAAAAARRRKKHDRYYSSFATIAFVLLLFREQTATTSIALIKTPLLLLLLLLSSSSSLLYCCYDVIFASAAGDFFKFF